MHKTGIFSAVFVAAAIGAASALAACGSTPPPPAAPTKWVVDDLHLDGDRYYITCEDADGSDYEKEVWLSEERASEYDPGAPCPSGEGVSVRTEPYIDDDSDDGKVVVVPKPRKPSTTSSKKPPATTGSVVPGPTSRTATPPVTTTTKPKITSGGGATVRDTPKKVTPKATPRRTR